MSLQPPMEPLPEQPQTQYAMPYPGTPRMDYPQPPPPYVVNHLVEAILTTLFCCMPFGVVAIVYAAQVNTFLATGNYPAAVDSSNMAWFWCKLSFFSMLGLLLFYLALIAIMAIFGASGTAMMERH